MRKNKLQGLHLLGAGALAGMDKSVRVEFSEPVSSFQRNWIRTAALAEFPSALTREVMSIEAARYRVYEHRFGTVCPTRDQFIQGFKDDDGEFVEDAVIDEYRCPQLKRGGGFVQMVHADSAVASVESTLYGTSAIGALLAAIVSSAWTAFEALAEDLWVAAINARPDPLVANFLDVQGKNQEKTIPIKVLSDYGHDLRSRMGDMLRDHEKADFQSLTSAGTAYVKAFGQAAHPLFRADDLVVLSKTRNLLAHRGGMIDETFARDMASVAHPFVNIEKNTELQLEGLAVRQLVESAFVAGWRLIRFVHDWQPAGSV